MKCEPQIADKHLFSLISIALEKGDQYHISLTIQQMEDLCGAIFTTASRKKDGGRLQDSLHTLAYYLEDVVVDLDDEAEDDDFSTCSKDSQNVYLP